MHFVLSHAANGKTHRPGLRSLEARSDEAAQILNDINREREPNPAAVRAVALCLATLLTSPAQAESTPARGGLAPWQKRKIDQYLKTHLTQRVRVDELAEHLSLSVSHFFRTFKESFGDTPQAHILRLKLEMAQKLMLATEDPPAQIAFACGFADQSHLCKTFRRLTGETPTAWRLRNASDAQAEAISRRSRRLSPDSAARVAIEAITGRHAD
jgi:AraC family transcriptional regulator